MTTTLADVPAAPLILATGHSHGYTRVSTVAQ